MTNRSRLTFARVTLRNRGPDVTSAISTQQLGIPSKVLTKLYRSREARRDEVTRDATKLLAIFGDEAHDEARRRLIGAMAGDGIWLRARAEIDRRTGYETGCPRRRAIRMIARKDWPGLPMLCPTRLASPWPNAEALTRRRASARSRSPSKVVSPLWLAAAAEICSSLVFARRT